MAYQITQTLTGEHLANILTSCFEGGYSPWLHTARKVKGRMTKGQKWYYADAEMLSGDGWQIKLAYDRLEDEEGVGAGTFILDHASVQKGLDAAAKDPNGMRCLSNLLSDNGNFDALDADALVQIMVFGEVVYG